MDIESEYGFRSVFYWLLKKDKMNADYNYSGSELQPAVRKVAERGWESGLHKSLRPLTLNEESTEIENYTGGNRYHYLNFTLPGGYDELDKSTVLLDTSLGFTEQYGFRNNYGRPFIPYNLKEDSLYNFVEVPMNIMDRTFFRERMDVKDVYSLLINWFEKNNADCVFTINFHNNFFSGLKYDGYTWLYKSLLTYFRDSGWKGISQAQLIDTYYRQSKQIES
jgi:hypothetical protein